MVSQFGDHITIHICWSCACHVYLENKNLIPYTVNIISQEFFPVGKSAAMQKAKQFIKVSLMSLTCSLYKCRLLIFRPCFIPCVKPPKMAETRRSRSIYVVRGGGGGIRARTHHVLFKQTFFQSQFVLIRLHE